MNKSRFSVRIAIYTIMVVLGMTSTLTRVPTAWSGGGGAPADGGGLPASGPSDIEGKQRVETNQRKAEPSGPQAVEQQDNEQRATGNPDKSVEGEVGNNTANDKDSDEEEIGELGVLDTERFKASARVVPFSGGNDKVVIHIVISDVIDLGLAPFISRVIADVKERSEVVAIVSEIDTPGGRVDAAVQIKDALLNASVPTVAWVHSEAISAGALIAYAHDFILFSEGGTMGAATPIQMGAEGGAEAVGEKVTSYMRGVMRATAEAKGRDGDVAEAMVDRSIHVPGISPKGRLLTLTDKQALRFGVGDGAADSFDDVLGVMKLTGAKIEAAKPNWTEEVARVLTGPVVSSMLMSLGMLGIIIELTTPGFGLPGILGLGCLFLFFLGHYITNLAGFEELLLFGLGVGLLAVEIFVIPGFGIAGVLGIGLVAVSLVLMLISLPISVSWDGGGLLDAAAQVSLSILATAVMMLLFFRFFPKMRAANRLVLANQLGSLEVNTTTDGVDEERSQWIGREGKAVGDLRPFGKASFSGQVVDVISEGQFVARGTSVRVILVENGQRLVVRPIADGMSPSL
ncbi:MAG: nodulation protein NfeD [Myxococcales bacterium]|nr:nodulation protein NfeD [Myxococcales bacterium]